ncbi:MAG: prepilin-type N-terminal cleavage/methylation domain-containing protein [Pseudobdellovibrionaceae bacterium]
MTQSNLQSRQTEKGFTLVELAIVMIIIGLLIGGILKGQELINNARVSSTASQIKAIESGISGFRDKYAGYPGDLTLASTKIPNCTAGFCGTAIAVGTPGNGVIENTGAVQNPGLAVGGNTVEAAQAFVQLAAAGFVGGVNPSATAVAVAGTNPSLPIGGAWVMGSSAGTATGMILTTGLPNGVYVALSPLLTAAVPTADASGTINPSAAANIDRKVDDGQPNTGIVRATGTGGNTTSNCASTNTAAGVYNEALGTTPCGIYAKVQ